MSDELGQDHAWNIGGLLGNPLQSRPAVQAYLIDLDGTLYAGAGAIRGAPETIQRLRRRQTPFRLVTNTTSRSRAMLLERLHSYGFSVELEEIFTATLAGRDLARTAGHISVAPFTPEPALEDLQPLELMGGTSGLPAQRTPDAVLIGDLGERWNYRLMQEAFEYLMDGAALIAFSRDRYWLREGRLALDAGPFVAGLEYATGKAAWVAGKPSPEFFQSAVRSLGSAPDTVAMVGDDLWSDVQGAQAAGLQGWLVRTGKFRESVLSESGIHPDRVLESVAVLE
jgi:HAD superfamily hydrolase (TIGR01458 family)